MFVRAGENFPTGFDLSLNIASFYLCVMGTASLSTENFQLLLMWLTVNGCGLLGLQQQKQKRSATQDVSVRFVDGLLYRLL